MDREIAASADEDGELVRAFNGGDAGAFDRLMLKYEDRVYTLCCRFLGDDDEAGDCAQETFVRVYRSLGTFKGASSFSTWIYAIALNTCRNRRQSLAFRIRKLMVGIDAPRETEDGEMQREIAGDDPTPPEELERRETERAVQAAIGALDEERRAVVLLRDVQGLSYEEIATVTGLNPGTVRSRLARARQDLKEKLKGYMR